MVVDGDALSGKQVVFLELLGFIRFDNVPGGAGGPFLGLSKLACSAFNWIAVGHCLGIAAWDSTLFDQPTKMGEADVPQFAMPFQKRLLVGV